MKSVHMISLSIDDRADPIVVIGVDVGVFWCSLVIGRFAKT